MRKIPPHLVLDPTDDMTILQEEIFGPLFPVKTYRTLDEVHPLRQLEGSPARLLLLHQRQGGARSKLLYGTISGGVTINNVVFHVAQHDMPFGGIGASGMGQYHGYEGFVEFSKMRPVFTNPKLSRACSCSIRRTPRCTRGCSICC